CREQRTASRPTVDWHFYSARCLELSSADRAFPGRQLCNFRNRAVVLSAFQFTTAFGKYRSCLLVCLSSLGQEEMGRFVYRSALWHPSDACCICCLDIGKKG